MNNQFLCEDFCLSECDVSKAEVAPASVYQSSWYILYSQLNT